MHLHFFLKNKYLIQVESILQVSWIVKHEQILKACLNFVKSKLSGIFIMATSQDDPDSQSGQHLQAKRINIRSETYACSSDRTTIEEMADHVISRYDLHRKESKTFAISYDNLCTSKQR